MGKLLKTFLLVVMVLGLLTGCAELMEMLGLDPGDEGPVDVSGVIIAALQADLTLGVDETLQLEAEVSPAEADNQIVFWSSADPDVVFISETGLVTALDVTGAAGVEITVTTDDGGFTDSVFIVVEEAAEEVIAVTGVVIDDDDLILEIDEEYQLAAIVSPEDAWDTDVTWESSDPDVVEVDATGLLTALDEGFATITVKTDDGDFTDSIEVEVEVVIPVTGVALLQEAIEVGVTRTYQLDVTVLPGDAWDQDVTWSSSDTDVAAVDENGMVTGVAIGMATITVTTDDGDFTDTVEVDVVAYTPLTALTLDTDAISIEANDTAGIGITFDPGNASVQTFSAVIDDDSVAEVLEMYGDSVEIRGLQVGTATLTVTSDDDPTISDTVDITVTADNTTPLLDTLMVLDETTLYVVYSEPINGTDLLDVSNYAVVTDPDGTATAAVVADVQEVSEAGAPYSIVYVILQNALTVTDEVQLTVTGVVDLAGNAIVEDGDANQQRATYVPAHDATLDMAKITEVDGQVTFEVDAVTFQTGGSYDNFDPDNYVVYVTVSGDALAESTVIAQVMLLPDGSSSVDDDDPDPDPFANMSGSEAYIFPNGNYDFYITGHYDMDGDFNDTDDQIMSFSDPILYSVTTGS